MTKVYLPNLRQTVVDTFIIMEAHGSSRRLTEMQVLGAIVKVMNKQELVKMKMSNLMRTNMMMTQMGVNMIQMTKLTLNPSDQC